LTYPIILWVARAFVPRCRHDQAVMKALSIVDDTFGFNRVLRTLRQRLSFQILARRGDLPASSPGTVAERVTSGLPSPRGRSAASLLLA